jgi:serine/threonine protein kinase
VDRVLGQYHLLEELGRGGMGSVYKARHALMDRVVAVKVLLPELVQNPLAVEWFRREVRAVTRLCHPNIVMAYDANEAEGVYFLVMEYVEGCSLDALVRRQGPLALPQACEIVRQAALALQYAHEQGMVHRDVKPGNLLLPMGNGEWGMGNEGQRDSSFPLPPSPFPIRVKVVDFGLARLQTAAKTDTILLQNQAGFLGTPDYCSPEQSRDIHAADIRSDLYSLGCAFYFALTGRVPFPAQTAMEKLVKHLMEEPTPVEQVQPLVPAGVAAVVRRLMAKDPARRFQTPAELAEELLRWCGSPTQTSLRLQEVPSLALRACEPVAVGAGQPEADASATNLLEKVPLYVFDNGRLRCDGPAEEPTDLESPNRAAPVAATASATDVTVVSAAALPPPPAAESVPPIALPPVADAPGPAGWSSAFRRSESEDRPKAELHPPAGPLPNLLRPWRQWTAVVTSCATRCGLSRLNTEKYRALYQRVLHACRAHADADPARADFFQHLEALVRPWLTLQTLQRTDAAMLGALARQCRQVEWELSGGREPLSSGKWIALLLLLLGPPALVGWLWTHGSRWLASLHDPVGRASSIEAALREFGAWLEAHPTWGLLVLVPTVVVLGLYWVSRTPRA